MCSSANGELTLNINFSVSEAASAAAFSPTKKSNSTTPIPQRFSSSLISSGTSSNDTSTTTEIGLSADTIGQLFDGQTDAIEKWLREKAPPDIVRRMHRVTDEVRRLTSPKRTASVTSDLFQQWMASSSSSTSPMMPHRSPNSRSVITNRRNLSALNDSELFMELIRDVANELDMDVLCHKILVNVGLLTHADRGSLFLAKRGRGQQPTQERSLVAKLFDVTQNTVLEDAVQKANAQQIIIPFGVGIAGTVAETKETINITDAYADERFHSEIDTQTGYKTKVMLSMPICNYEGDVIGVAQIINKTNDSGAFTDKDIEVFGRYLTFCGIGIQNAQLFEMSVQEYRRNQILLHLARSIFEEQNNLECLVTKILMEARGLLKCERCSVYLLDLDCCESSHLQKIIEKPAAAHQHAPLSRRQSHNVNVEDILAQQKSQESFTMLFELDPNDEVADVSRPTLSDLGDSTLAQIAQNVATTGSVYNISKLSDWLVEHSEIRAGDTERIDTIESILCMPIVNGQKKVIGVVQLINKANHQPFANEDVSILEAFAIFCGLGIHNTQMYENACKLMAKQKVALECLSYHATASHSQTNKLIQDTILSAENYALYSFKFIDSDLSEDDTCRATIRMFLQCNLVQQFHIPYDVLCRWILSIRKNYRPLKYHNWRHGFNVTQTMFAVMKTGKMERFVTDLEILGLLVACLCHDLDHRGTNNSFQTKTDSPLAILYTTSTMEHHHFDQCVMILNSEGNNIFQALSPEDYRRVMKIVEMAILSTDLAVYFKKKKEFVRMVENGEFGWQAEDKKELLCGILMTACDVSAIAKPWEVQHRVAKLVADEFFDQGDLEKLQLNTQPVAMMDRERKDELPKMQVGFIDFICAPLYRMLADTFPWIQPLYEGTLNNRQHWQDLAEKVEMGLTWIDHDTIDKPVEEFAAHPEEIKDIEFTVTSLNCAPAQTTSDTSPRRRHRFSSLRKTGALSKVMRSRLSRSFYSHCDRKKTESMPVQAMRTTQSAHLHHPPTLTEDQSNGHRNDHQLVATPTTATSTAAGSTPTSSADVCPSVEKHKKRSKLCVAL